MAAIGDPGRQVYGAQRSELAEPQTLNPNRSLNITLLDSFNRLHLARLKTPQACSDVALAATLPIAFFSAPTWRFMGSCKQN